MELISQLPTLETVQEFLWTQRVYNILISLILLGIIFILQRTITNYINRQIEDANKRHISRKITHYLLTAAALLGLAFIWVRNLAWLTTITGFIAAGIAIALKDVIMSLLGWIKILWIRNLSVGDRIELAEVIGDVIDITPLYIIVLEVGKWVDAHQSTGRIVFIPNNHLFQDPLFNYTHAFPYLWDELTLIFTFESDFKMAEELLKEPLETEIGVNYKRARSEIRQVGEHYAISYNHLQPRIYMTIVDSGVKLTMRYLTRARGRREIRSRLSKVIMENINATPEVELAYPTYRTYRLGETPQDAPDQFIPQ